MHSSVDKYWGGLHFLAITSSVTMNIHIRAFVWIYFFNSPGYISMNDIAQSCSISMFNLSGIPKKFSRAPFMFSAARYEDSNFSTSSPTLVIVCLFKCIYLIIYSLVKNIQLVH